MSEILTLENLLYEKKENENNVEGNECETCEDNYKDILDKITQIITEKHSKDLAEGLYSKKTTQKVKDLIKKYIISEKLMSENIRIGELIDRIYEDMAGIGFIKKYLEDFDVEEININGYNNIWAVYGDRKEKLPEAFRDNEDCINIVKKMARMGGLILDGSTPIGDSYISKGVRMSAAISPAVGEDAGAIASIRKQKPSYITKERLISYGTATEDELEFLSLAINNKVSIAIAGATGAGKTADMNFLLNEIKKGVRIVTIEDTKELLPKGKDVVQLYTKEPPNPITMNDHLKLSLRLHPNIFIPAEMRGAEAISAIEAARTGHTALTSIHASSAIKAYDRMLTMYRQGDANLSEETILRMIIEAFPIVVFKMQLPDGSRKYIDIFEAIDVQNGKVVGSSIFKFMTTHTEKDESGKIIKIHGEHKRVGNISKKLAETMLLNGADKDIVEKYLKGA